jgi:hypothetical protein
MLRMVSRRSVLRGEGDAMHRLLLVALICCSMMAIDASRGGHKPPPQDDAVIKAFVAFLGNYGVKLELGERNWWVVTDPKGDGYKVNVSLKTFPLGTSHKEMQATLAQHNLAYMLNAPARLAMSHPGLEISDPTKKPPKLDQIPVALKLENLFKEYLPPRDPVYMHLPEEIRKVFEETFPDHRCIRLVIRGEKEATVYRATVFHPAAMSSISKRVGEEQVTTPPLDYLELDAGGKVLEESLHFVDTGRLPKPVTAAYEKWNPKGVTAREHFWLTEVPRGKDRVYRIRMIENAVKGYTALFKEDGTVVEANPDIVPWLAQR